MEGNQQRFILDFKLQFDLPSNMKICMLGSISELSSWNFNNPQVFFALKDGLWQMEKELVVSQPIFTYKFAIYRQDGIF